MVPPEWQRLRLYSISYLLVLLGLGPLLPDLGGQGVQHDVGQPALAALAASLGAGAAPPHRLQHASELQRWVRRAEPRHFREVAVEDVQSDGGVALGRGEGEHLALGDQVLQSLGGRIWAFEI